MRKGASWELKLGRLTTTRSLRRVPVPEPLARWISDELDTRARLACKTSATALDPKAPLVLGPDGGRQTPDRFSHAVTAMGAHAGIVGMRVHPHLLRHTAATLMLNAGVDIAVVANILGDSVEITARYYAHVLDAARIDAVGKLVSAIHAVPGLLPEAINAGELGPSVAA